LRFIRRGKLNRFIIGFITVYALGLAALWFFTVPLTWAYLSIVSGNDLLGVSSATVDTSIKTDDNLVFTLCRDPKIRIIAVNNIRTFYLNASGEQVAQRHMPDGILYEKLTKPCAVIKVSPENRPNKPGTYYFCQSFDFYTKFDQKKTASFCTTNYTIEAGR
jgi:hypothetical protein